MREIYYMSYKNSNNEEEEFRLIARIDPYFKEFARALNFPNYTFKTAKNKGDDGVDWLIGEWLRGANMSNDKRPITWDTLIAALKEAGMKDEVDIIENYIVIPRKIPLSTSKS